LGAELAAVLALAAVAVAVGFFIGAVGVGGVLLIPALAVLGGMEIHRASATALFTFLFTGMLGTWLFYRRGSIDWHITVPVCLGSVVFSYVGALVSSHIAPRPLALIIASIIVFAGAYVLLPSRRGEGAYRTGHGTSQQVLLACLGAVAGFGSGLSGAGGALFSVPLMMALGFPPLAAIGTSQVLQIIVATSGTVGNLQFGSVDFATAAWVSALSLAGVGLGTRAAHAVPVLVLRRAAAGLCIAVGLFMLVRNL
jgi:uncharacterized membrane protein YfcA